MIDTQRNKNLQPGDPITFIVGTSAFDGVIQEKTNMDAGDISFLIKLIDGTQTRIKHNKLRKMFIKEFPDKHLHNPHTD